MARAGSSLREGLALAWTACCNRGREDEGNNTKKQADRRQMINAFEKVAF